MKNLSGLMKQAQQMQEKMQEMQSKLEALEIEGVAGAGLVVMTLNGKGDLRRIKIDPKIIVRPPWRSQSKGQDVSHRLYPDLKFLPLHHGPPTPR